MNKWGIYSWRDVGALVALLVLVLSLVALVKAGCWFMVALVLLLLGYIVWESFRQ